MKAAMRISHTNQTNTEQPLGIHTGNNTLLSFSGLSTHHPQLQNFLAAKNVEKLSPAGMFDHDGENAEK